MNWTFTLADMALTVVVAGLVGCLLARWAWRPRNAAPTLPAQWAISARPALDAHERRLYRQLRSAFPRHLILPKLALVRFCRPDDGTMGPYWYSLLGSGHVTFAVCSARGVVVLAVDLEGKRMRSRRSLQIRQGVLAACGVKHLRLSAGQLPGTPELRLVLPPDAIADRVRAPQKDQVPAPPLLDATPEPVVAARGAPRKPKWQDPGLFQDSFFSTDSATSTSSSVISRPVARTATVESAATSPPHQHTVGSMDLPLTMER